MKGGHFLFFSFHFFIVLRDGMLSERKSQHPSAHKTLQRIISISPESEKSLCNIFTSCYVIYAQVESTCIEKVYNCMQSVELIVYYSRAASTFSHLVTNMKFINKTSLQHEKNQLYKEMKFWRAVRKKIRIRMRMKQKI